MTVLHLSRTMLLHLLFLIAPLSAAAQSTTWGDFSGVTSTGVPFTVSLGGGSTVDIEVTTGGTMGLATADLGDLGSPETGLSYTSLTTLNIFNGGGAGTVSTTLTFSNFTPASSHVRGFFMVSNVAGPSSPITLSSSVPGIVPSWTQVGSSFDAPFPGDLGSAAITWNAAAGTLSTLGPPGDNSQGIVINIGSLSAYGTVTVQLSQNLNDGINFSLGEESALPVPALGAHLLVTLAVFLGLSGSVASRRAA